MWPRFEKESRYFDFLAARGWVLKDRDGRPVDGLAERSDRAGALLDSTNPQARAWYWERIRDNIASQGFDWFWLDETEPDLVPDGSFYLIGTGDRYHNVFPLLHTQAEQTEAWSYGKAAEGVISKYLRLRYTLLPYIYSLGKKTYDTGAPFMRALFMDFPDDPQVANLGDEYMFGPAFLVAPVTEQGRESRRVYLPAGRDWYNFWTNEKFKGGQTIAVAAPIDSIPLFVASGSIIPLGSDIQNTSTPQALREIRVYPGRDTDFVLYDDDGVTYGYEKGEGRVTQLHWDDLRGQLAGKGAPVPGGSVAALVKVVR